MLVVVPLPLALVLHLLVQLPALIDQAAFVLAAAAFGVGTFLILPWDGEDDRGGGADDPDPAPWWPEFEREFHAYAARRVRV
jgi:hypothetical protein